MSNTESREATLNTLIRDQIETRLKRLHTVTPGIIDSFDPATGRASIQPTIQRVLVSGEFKTLPKLINCPIGNIKAGGFVLTMPVKVGNECMIHFTERSLDAWIKFGTVRQPNDLRLHHESDAYFVPMTTSEPEATTDYDADNMVLRNVNNDLKMVFDTDGNLTLDAVSTVTMNVPDTLINSNVVIDGTLEVKKECDLASNGPGTGVKMNGGDITRVVTTGSINPSTGLPFPDGNTNITGDA